MDIYDVVIIGGGCAGLSAGMYSGRFNLKVALFGETMGGTIILTDVVENYPGFKRLTGFDLAQNLREHMMDYPVEVIEEKVIATQKNSDGTFTVKSASKTVQTKTIIFATGTIWRKLGVPGEEEFANKGVHYCALCDGAFYKGKNVAVIGGSDSAAKDALALTQWANRVYMIYRGEMIHPEPINKTRCDANPKIEVINKTNVTHVHGENGKVTSVTLDKPYKGSTHFSLEAIFVAIGHIILNDLPKSLGVAVNGKGEVIIDRKAQTNVPGVYAAGDLVDTEFKQAITGAAEGVLASYSAYEYIKSKQT